MTAVGTGDRFATTASVLAAALFVAGCSSTEPTDGARSDVLAGATTPSVERLAELRDAADLAPCPAAAGVQSTRSDLPTVRLGCLDGGPDVDVPGLVGTPYVVNFWASNCGPCKDEGPHLQAVSEEASGRFQVLGVNYLDPGGEAGALAGAREFGMRFPSLFDPDGLLGPTFRFQGLPATFFVDADGVVVGQHVGAFDSADELRDAVELELGVRL